MLYIPTNVLPRHIPMAAVRGGRGIDLSISNLGVRWGWVVYKPCPGHYTPGKSPGTHCTESWLGPRASLDGRGEIISSNHRGSNPKPSKS
jgi:hypothetical protein